MSHHCDHEACPAPFLHCLPDVARANAASFLPIWCLDRLAGTCRSVDHLHMPYRVLWGVLAWWYQATLEPDFVWLILHALLSDFRWVR